MSNSDIKLVLDSISDIPFAYSHYKKGKEPALPYGVWYEDGDTSIKADSKTACIIQHFTIELYTALKSPETVKKIVTVLDNNEIAYDIIGEQYLDDEDMYMTIIELD